MSGRNSPRKILVIGSGPIIIGQAAEFDYAGTQACRALREEGLEVVLLNSNPATIMTDPATADRVYLDPLTPEYAEAVIRKERPDSLLPTLGGQVGLNLAMELLELGILERYNVRLLGTPPRAIHQAEDREAFKSLMKRIGEPVPQSQVIRSVEDARRFIWTAGFPVIARPAFTLGGTGGGVAKNRDELEPLVERALRASPVGQVLLEESLIGWKEIEFEVMRDGSDHCITVCSMENVDPMGIHTGDSIVVAPTQTVADWELQKLRSAAIRIIRALGVEGGCNVQFALRPDGREYRVIEVNPRVSRSSALASKATGYPIAKIAAKIALGQTLAEIPNPVTGNTFALFEPVLDYVVVKIPRWPFDKFVTANRRLGTQMKATGEVMALDRTFEGALLKAVRSLEIGRDALVCPEARSWSEEELDEALAAEDDQRIFYLAEALRRGRTLADLAAKTGIDRFFLEKIQNIIRAEETVRNEGLPRDPARFRRLKRLGIPDSRLAELIGDDVDAVRTARRAAGLTPAYKIVDTCAGEFAAKTPYFYSTYEKESELEPGRGEKILVLGSGPIRIGQGIEFDYCSVHAVQTLKRLGYEAIMMNNNPETVSTDFDTADRLYFEPLTPEDVLHVVEVERPIGVLVQFGGQTALNLAAPLASAGVEILGTDVNAIDTAESRELLDRVLARLGVARPPGGSASSREEARRIAARLGYPVMVRPSYVLGGRAMEIASNESELDRYLTEAARVDPGRPVWVDRYVEGIELEVDAVGDGEVVVVPGIMRHIERAGVHSGDSIAEFPARDLEEELTREIVEVTVKISRALPIRGMVNLQFVYDGNRLYLLEVNPRASRTVPFLTKATGLPLVDLATRAALGESLGAAGWSSGLARQPDHVAVKCPVFSWNKLPGVDAFVGPEMKSTGEVMGMGSDRLTALARGLTAAGFRFPRKGEGIFFAVSTRKEGRALHLARRLHEAGMVLYVPADLARPLIQAGLKVTPVAVQEGDHSLLFDPARLRDPSVRLVIDDRVGRDSTTEGAKLRWAAVERGIPCLTSLETAEVVADILTSGILASDALLDLRALQERFGEVVPH